MRRPNAAEPLRAAQSNDAASYRETSSRRIKRNVSIATREARPGSATRRRAVRSSSCTCCSCRHRRTSHRSLFLASDEARCVTGGIFPVDAGYSAFNGGADVMAAIKDAYGD
jgi:hypothetical protein